MDKADVGNELQRFFGLSVASRISITAFSFYRGTAKRLLYLNYISQIDILLNWIFSSDFITINLFVCRGATDVAYGWRASLLVL
jgi:hypothetical protein